jgi:cystathionine gamma-lyase/cystathionine gamma-lyase/homocysteine desulfhydrase
LAPFSAWLLKRSLQTIEIRLEKHKETTDVLVDFLRSRKEVEHVFYPDIDGQQLTSYATLVFFRLSEPYKHSYRKFSSALKLFSTGTGMACVTSMVAQPFSGSHASMCDAEKAEMGLDESIVRLSFGLENSSDLQKDLTDAFNSLEG